MADVDDLRSRLDAASFQPRGRWKELWVAAGTEFAAPAAGLVDRLLGDRSSDQAALAGAWLERLEGPAPRVPWQTWKAALAALDPREISTQTARKITAALRTADDPEAMVSFVVGALGDLPWKISRPLFRFGLLDLPIARAAAVALLLRADAEEFRAHAFTALAFCKELPSEARGAMWLNTWADPKRVAWDWDGYARLREPAALACTLSEPYQTAFCLEDPALRPAFTRALCRIIAREDPWLEPIWSEERSGEGAVGEKVLQRALDALSRVVQIAGDEDLARATLDTRWQALGLGGAIARGWLGGLDAVDALAQALGGPRAFEAMRALAHLGTGAASALTRVRGLPDGRDRTLTLAALEPSDAALDALIPLAQLEPAQLSEKGLQYVEGLITLGEYAGMLEPALECVRLWKLHGLNEARRAAWGRAHAAVSVLPELAGTVSAQRLVLPQGE